MNAVKRARLGITIPALVKKARELKSKNQPLHAEALLSAMMQDSEVSSALQGEELDGLDWESLLAFIERILPLILKIISLF